MEQRSGGGTCAFLPPVLPLRQAVEAQGQGGTRPNAPLAHLFRSLLTEAPLRCRPERHSGDLAFGVTYMSPSAVTRTEEAPQEPGRGPTRNAHSTP
jgi:hypothetical protein